MSDLNKKVTKQSMHIMNALTGKPLKEVATVTKHLSEIIKAVEESGWISTDDIAAIPSDQLVRIWNNTHQIELTGKYIHKFSVCTDDARFEGDTEYNEEDDRTYWPEGWYVFCEHVALDYTYGLCLDEITHFKYLVTPDFIQQRNKDQNNG